MSLRQLLVRRVPLIACGFACALVAVCGATAASAQEDSPRYPNRPVRIIVESSPGTAVDFFARVVAEELATTYGRQIIVNNRTGAGGLIGNTAISRAPPDGYTLGMVSLTRLVNELLRDAPPYRALDDATAVTQVASVTHILVVPSTLPVRTVAGLVAYTRGQPGDLNYASLGIGHSTHIAAALFVRAAGLDVQHVPFRMLNEAYIEMLLGRVHFCTFTLPSALPLVRDRRLRALAVTTLARSTALPEVPTMAEAGWPEATFDNWSGIIVPTGTPRRLVEQLHGDVGRVLRRPEIQALFARQGAVPTPDSSPGLFTELMQYDYSRYRDVIRKAAIKAE